MSKNFEEEYKALANNDLPDLWDRIEAGLSSKTIISQSSEVQGTIEETEAEEVKTEEVKAKEVKKDETEAEVNNQEKQSGSRKVIFLAKYKSVLAAAICVIVILPAVLVLGKINTGKSFSTTEAADEASDAAAPMMEVAEETTDAAAGIADASDIAEEPEEEAAFADEEATNDVAAMSFEDGIVKSAEENSALKKSQDKLSAEGTADEAIAEDSEEAITDMSKGSGSSRTQATEILYPNVTVRVVEATGDEVITQKDWFCGMKVEVVSDPAGELEQGTELTLWVSLASSVMYVNGEEYELDISYDPDRECDYQIEVTHF